MLMLNTVYLYTKFKAQASCNCVIASTLLELFYLGCVVLKAYKYRLYPNKEQRILIEKHFGCSRFVYNYALEKKIEAYKKDKTNLSRYDLQKTLPELKKEYTWLKEVSAQALQMKLIPLENAYKNYFRELKQGKYTKKELKEGKGKPKFKSKYKKQSFQVCQNINIDWNSSKLTIPKIKDIKIKLLRKFEGILKSVTISRTPTNKYYASILVDTPEKPKRKLRKLKKSKIVGIDLGITHFATLSNGKKIKNPKHLKKKLRQLKIAQRRASKKKKGSKNRKKANLKVAKIHEKISNARRDFLHKLSTELVCKSHAIIVEDLNVSGMMKNHRLAQAISDVSWSEFTRQIEYKCAWYGKHFIQVDRFFPSSKLCSKCGHINKELKLSDRTWVCPVCKTKHDRDRNASRNIKNEGIKLGFGKPKSKPAEKSVLSDSMKQEVNSYF